MTAHPTFTVTLPTADRATSLRFYTEALGLTAFGEAGDDGLPEPLQFDLGGAHLMFIPPGGFGWVTGGHATAEHGTSECLLSLRVADRAEVDDLVERARAVGAQVVDEPEEKPWGYVATIADPDAHLWQITASLEA